MEHTDVSRRGGQNSRKNLPEKKKKRLALKAAKASWEGHTSGGECACKRCKKA